MSSSAGQIMESGLKSKQAESDAQESKGVGANKQGNKSEHTFED